MPRPRCFAILALAVLAMPAWAEPDRGQQLYETHCINCHTTSVHSRERRVAQDFNGIRQWVARWNENLSLGLSDEDILEVTLYLNRRFYNFPGPAEPARLISSAPAARVPN